MEIVNVNEKARFLDNFAPLVLKSDATHKTPLICMKPGQMIPPHPGGAGVFYIVSGKGIMTVGEEETEVGPGDMIFVEKGAERGIRAVETLLAFAVHVTV